MMTMMLVVTMTTMTTTTTTMTMTHWRLMKMNPPHDLSFITKKLGVFTFSSGRSPATSGSSTRRIVRIIDMPCTAAVFSFRFFFSRCRFVNTILFVLSLGALFTGGHFWRSGDAWREDVRTLTLTSLTSFLTSMSLYRVSQCLCEHVCTKPDLMCR